MPLPDIHPLNEVPVNGSCPTVVSGQFGYIRAPYTGRLTKVATSIGATVGTGDATCTVTVAGAAVTGGVITITSAASAIGDNDEAVVNAPCTEGDSIRFAMTGTGTGGGPVHLTAYIRRGG